MRWAPLLKRFLSELQRYEETGNLPDNATVF
ncbi:hypothetical protein MPNT_10321 [Candidatus Methylacidithermus pantelleriae]|uniref:Uncharacterized protein n=1 Tax=Candidatus Methylacidithermus pantelleriae TaxID=2744239 RepID=A0A8J2BIT9_9BACT|nr:hypothetical protein MPNT_10321 [Candidatus Methylacidithermus pantelleriae]